MDTPIHNSPVSGTFIVDFYGHKTAPIPYNATDAEIDTAIKVAVNKASKQKGK